VEGEGGAVGALGVSDRMFPGSVIFVSIDLIRRDRRHHRRSLTSPFLPTLTPSGRHRHNHYSRTSAHLQYFGGRSTLRGTAPESVVESRGGSVGRHVGGEIARSGGAIGQADPEP